MHDSPHDYNNNPSKYATLASSLRGLCKTSHARACNSHLELDTRRHDDGPERQRVRADGRDHDGWYGGMDHTGACCDSVSRRACGRADDETVALDARHVFAVDEEVDVGEIR